jgi:hypothetical protein
VLGHSLQLMRRGDLPPTLKPAFYTYPFILQANLVVCFAAVFKRGAEEIWTSRLSLHPAGSRPLRPEPLFESGRSGSRKHNWRSLAASKHGYSGRSNKEWLFEC